MIKKKRLVTLMLVAAAYLGVQSFGTDVALTGGTSRLGKMVLLAFFFSSRRRHTRFDCDWSSDVCSSDLTAGVHEPQHAMPEITASTPISLNFFANVAIASFSSQIGRASCRERV